MNEREKKLALLTAALMLALAMVFMFRRLLWLPWQGLDNRIAAVQATCEKLDGKVRAAQQTRRQLAQWAGRSLGQDAQAVSEAARARLLKYLTLANLTAERFSLTPVSGRRLAGRFQEIGWHIKGRGRLEAVVDFLYLLQSDPALHVLSNLSLTYSTGPYEVILQVRWITLVLPADKNGTSRVLDLPKANPLDQPARRPYQVIVRRDLFRPYIARPPARPQPPAVASTRPSGDRPARPSRPGPTRPKLRLVGLPVWPGQQDRPRILVLDTASRTTRELQLGDELAGGRIAWVDYRPLPRHDQPQVISPSRIILVRDQAFWAIELGDYIGDLYRLDKDRLPPELLRQAVVEP